MYIDVDSAGFVTLAQMNSKEAEALAKMITNAGLEERRSFNGVLNELKKEGYI